jgi:hypothetical protein
MATSAICPLSEDEALWDSRFAEFHAAYEKMKGLSREYTAVLMMSPPGILSPEEHRARLDKAGQAYQAAHEDFMAAVRNVHRFGATRVTSPVPL